MSSVHRTVVVVADDGTSPVGSDEWNGQHNTSVPDGGTWVEVDHAVYGTTERLIAAGTGRVIMRQVISPMAGAFGMGTFTIPSDRYVLQYKRATLTPGTRATLSGTSELFLFDLAPVGRLVLAGRGG